MKRLSMALILSSPAHAWVEEGNGIGNDFFYLDFANVSYGAHVSESVFKQSVGNVIDYWADLLDDNHDLSGQEKIQVDVYFSDLGKEVLGNASYALYSSLPAEFKGYENTVNKTFLYPGYEYLTTHSGTQFTAYTAAQAKLLGKGDVAGSDPDFTINFNNTQQFYYGDAAGKSLTNSADPTFEQYDFESVLLHEIAHGMGVASALKYSSATDTTSLTPFTTDSGLHILDADGNPLYFQSAWDSLIGIDINNKPDPGDSLTITADTVSLPIYNPDPWESGSSLSHPVTDSVLNKSIRKNDIFRSFNTEELYLLEGLGYDIAGIDFTERTIPEPSSVVLSLLALPFILSRRRRRRA